MEAQAKQEIITGLEFAIRTESDGHHFYLMAAKSTLDQKGKEVFELLASEELEHQTYLQQQRKSLLEKGLIDPNLRLGQRAPLDGEHPIFSESLASRAGEAHFEMSALSIAIQLELNSQNFYREQAGKAADEGVRSFYARLAEWESGHYQALMRQHDNLKDDYWSSAGFAPF